MVADNNKNKIYVVNLSKYFKYFEIFFFLTNKENEKMVN